MNKVRRYEMTPSQRCGEAWQDLEPQSDGDWVSYEDYAVLDARVQAVERELVAEQQRADRLYKDRYALLSATTTDGLSAAEWQMRTATAEQEAKDQKAKQEALVTELNAIKATVGDTEYSLRQQLAEAQGTRLRESLVEYMQLADKICYAEPELTQYRQIKTKAERALRETGA